MLDEYGAKFCGKCGAPQGGAQPTQPAVKRLYFDAKGLTLFNYKFDIMDGADNLIAEAIQKVNLINYIYELKQLGISLSGNFLKLEFDFIRNGAPIAKVRKKFLFWADSYELEFSDPSLERVLLACIMMIQIVCAIQRRRRH